MEPKTFGPFLRELRKRRGLTQEQLAEGLHVSGAAVSKWENGKCLPDISKIGDLAALLDVSVLEVMKCEMSGAEEAPAPRQAMSEVFSETVKTVERRNRRRLVLAASMALCAAALAVLLHYFPVHHIPQIPLDCYNAREVSLLLHIGSREERQAARTVLDQAELAFSDLSLSHEEAIKTYGHTASIKTAVCQQRPTSWSCGPSVFTATTATCGCTTPGRAWMKTERPSRGAGRSPHCGGWERRGTDTGW